MRTYALCFSLLFACLIADAKTLVEKNVSSGHSEWLVQIDTAPSKPKSKGQGFCGAGRELTLTVRKARSKKIAFSKLIESCLKSIELKDVEPGSDDVKSLLQAVDLQKDPIEIHWLTVGDRSGVVGKIDLSSDQVKYSEVALGL